MLGTYFILLILPLLVIGSSVAVYYLSSPSRRKGR